MNNIEEKDDSETPVVDGNATNSEEKDDSETQVVVGNATNSEEKDASDNQDVKESREPPANVNDKTPTNEPAQNQVKVDSPTDITTLNIEFTEPSTYKIVKEGGHTVTRNDSKSCFVYVPKPQKQEETSSNTDKKTESNGMFSWLSTKAKTKVAPTQGGKLKTKKNRKTKKRNQKKGFKSRSKK